MITIEVGRRFSERFRLTASAIRDFAVRSHDDNPVHSDPTFARTTRFENIIASGPHLSSIMMCVTATYFSNIGGMLGLEFSFRFRSPIMADEGFVAEWLIIRSSYRKTPSVIWLTSEVGSNGMMGVLQSGPRVAYSSWVPCRARHREGSADDGQTRRNECSSIRY